MKETIKKLIVCKAKECPFGLKKIDDQCNICRFGEGIAIGNQSVLYILNNRAVYVISNEIKPVFVEIEKEIEFKCYINLRLPLHNECPFGRKKVSKECRGCARLQEIILKTKTKEL